MSYPINYPRPQGANIQIFNAGDTTGSIMQTWVKPQGASFVWFTLIGGGGSGDASTGGGGSGVVTNCMVPAFLIPDILTISVGKGGTTGLAGAATRVLFFNQPGIGGTLNLLLQASGGQSGAGVSSADSPLPFSAMGFYQSTAGASGASGTVSASSTTFLSGGGSGVVTANYGYQTSTFGTDGYFQTQPIIVGVGAGSGSDTAKAGIGCGGAYGTSGGFGGNGLVVIITW